VAITRSAPISSAGLAPDDGWCPRRGQHLVLGDQADELLVDERGDQAAQCLGDDLLDLIVSSRSKNAACYALSRRLFRRAATFP
jgi:hypothetical protein